MLGRLLKNVRLRCDWSLWWAVVGLATKMSRGAGEDHRGAGVDVRVAKIVRSDPGAHMRLRGGPLSVVVRKVARGWESSLWCSHRPCGDKIVVSQGLVRTGMLSWPLKNVRWRCGWLPLCGCGWGGDKSVTRGWGGSLSCGHRLRGDKNVSRSGCSSCSVWWAWGVPVRHPRR